MSRVRCSKQHDHTQNIVDGQLLQRHVRSPLVCPGVPSRVPPACPSVRVRQLPATDHRPLCTGAYDPESALVPRVYLSATLSLRPAVPGRYLIYGAQMVSTAKHPVSTTITHRYNTDSAKRTTSLHPWRQVLAPRSACADDHRRVDEDHARKDHRRYSAHHAHGAHVLSVREVRISTRAVMSYSHRPSRTGTCQWAH